MSKPASHPTRSLVAGLLVIGAAVAGGACGASEPAPAPSVTREIDESGVEIVTSSAPTWSEAERWIIDAEPAVQIGVETGAPEYMLSNVGGAVRLDDGRIVVADGDVLVLRVYDAEGRYLESLGGQGGGPGEFEYLFGVLNCGPGELWALVLPRAFSRFGADGEFIDLLRITLPEGGTPYMHTCNGAGQHLAIGWGTPRRQLGLYRTTTHAWVLAPAGEVLADLGEVHGSERWGSEGGSGPHDYGRQTALALGDERAYVGEADDFEVRVFDLDGALVRRIRWGGNELALGPDEIQRYKDWYIETNELGPDSRWTQELIKMEFPATMPAYTALQLDPAGNLWVRRFSRPGIREEDWDVFAPDGAWLGTLSAPIGLQITEIEQDVIVGIYQDELGTEYVRLHRIRRGDR